MSMLQLLPTSYFKPGKLPEVQLVCITKEYVGSKLCENEEGEFYQKKTLPDLVSVKSYLLFNLLQIEDLSWLDAPVALWLYSPVPTYVTVRNFVHQLLTVNDGAERGIKLKQELIDKTN